MAKVGRPSEMTPETINKLEYAFSMGCSDLEACLFADIGKTTLYAYQNNNPEFTERKQALKENPVLKSRQNVLSKIIAGDVETSRWLLERKKKDEFSTRSETENTHTFTQMPSVKIGKDEITFNVGEDKTNG